MPTENRESAPTFYSRLFDNHTCLTCALREQTIYRLQYRFNWTGSNTFDIWMAEFVAYFWRDGERGLDSLFTC